MSEFKDDTPYIVDDMSLWDRICVNKRPSKKLFQKIVEPMILDLLAMRERNLDSMNRMEELLSMATRFDVGVTKRGSIVRVELRHKDKGHWAVLVGPFCLDSDGELDYESSPSNRTEDFIQRTRFSRDEAIKRAMDYLAKGKDEQTQNIPKERF